MERITHLGVCVSDLDRSVAFYRDVLGLTEQRRLHVADDETAALLEVPGVDLDLVYLARDGLVIELLRYRAPGAQGDGTRRPMNEVGLTHLSIAVDDLDGVVERVERGGGAVVPGTRVMFHGTTRAVMALDPDGTRLELIERRS